MSPARQSSGGRSSEERSYLLGLARGFGAAIIFSIPMLMTMEMWWLGFYMDRLRLAIAALLMLPLLIALSFFAGLRPNARAAPDRPRRGHGLRHRPGRRRRGALPHARGQLHQAPREIIGKVVLLGLAASFGSMLGRRELGSRAGKRDEAKRKQSSGWLGQMVLMVAGALYLSLTVAPTVEMVKIPYKMTPWHALAMVVVSLALMHAFVYTLRFKGSAQAPEGTPWWSLFLRYTVPGYVIATGVAAYLLWTFGRFGSFDPYWILMYSVALGFPASVGAAAGRLIL